MTDPQTYQATSRVNATWQAIQRVIWLWHIAECRHALRGTKCEPQSSEQ